MVLTFVIVCGKTDFVCFQAAEERVRSMLYKLIKYSKQVCVGYCFVWHITHHRQVWGGSYPVGFVKLSGVFLAAAGLRHRCGGVSGQVL